MVLKGLSLNWLLSNDGTQILVGPTDVANLQVAGAQVVRVGLRLGTHMSWDSALIGQYTAVLKSLQDAGLRVIAILGSEMIAGLTQSQWNANNAENGGSGTNPFLHQFVSTAKTLVHAFPQVAVWEIWNEPDAWTSHPSETVYTGGSYIYPSLYGALLQQAYAAIKQLAPQATVLTGGLLAHDNGGALTYANSGAAYLTDLYEQIVYGSGGGPLPFDAVGQHYYIDQGSALVPEHLQRYLTWLQNTIAYWEGSDNTRPIWVTEIGWTTRQVSPQVQAANLTAAFGTLEDNQAVAVACNFQERDNPAGGQFYGLFASDWTPKPALTAFQQA